MTLPDWLAPTLFGYSVGTLTWTLLSMSSWRRRHPLLPKDLNQTFRQTRFQIAASGQDAVRLNAMTAVAALMNAGLPANAAAVAVVVEQAFPDADPWPWRGA